MEAKDILKADLLDLLFDQRNKQYGAYQLRKTYARRLGSALAATLAAGLLAAALIQPSKGEADDTIIAVREVVLQNIAERETPPPPPPPPPKAEAPAPKKPAKNAATAIAVTPQVKRTKYTPPDIVADKEVTNTEVPPVDAIAKVDVIDVAGVVDNDLAVPPAPVLKAPADGGKDPGSVLVPEQKEDENKIFEKVEIQARVNTGQWRRHLERHLARYIEDAAYAGMPPGRYTVMVRFLVEKDGRIGRVTALNKPGYGLARGAEEVVKTGPRWLAAEQNGRKVRSYHTQPITFVIMES